MYALRFAIDERPVCVWAVDAPARSHEFFSLIDPAYFEYVARINAQQLSGDDAQRAALSLRTAYSQGLEALMALLCATFQAPDCVYGWLSSYRTRELHAVVRKISLGSPVLTKVELRPVTWESLALAIHEPLVLPDKESESGLKSGFGRMWRRFATDFLSEIAAEEYNSIKHGHRARPGGFSLGIGEEEIPGVACPPEKMSRIPGSNFGSTFFRMEPLAGSKLNFRTRRQSRNWSPTNFGNGLMLIAMSLENVLARLRVVAGESAERVKFHFPSRLEAFESPWEEVPGVLSAGFDFTIDASKLQLLDRAEILRVYESTNTQPD